ncbi:MAG TPA: T9SS type A sorting domain-containing protein [Flavobacteriales bacterium]|nr:T9SS type A sorting domain-containing protein [Flavobacteriales bacterium]
MLRCALALPIALCVNTAFAQAEEHPFIESFTLAAQEGRVLLEWTMKGGSTCDGSMVERSTDGENFLPVHRIEGLCGDPEVAVHFSWADADPPELSDLYYRIVFAAEGRSLPQQVRFDQLNRSTHRVYPSPTDGMVRLLLRVPLSAQVDLRVFEANGGLVLERLAQTGRSHEIDLTGFAAGSYQVVAIADGQRFDARVVKQ